LSRGGRVIVDRLSFKLEGGEALMLTGPNGSGKTTLLRALAGFLAPTGGTICLEAEENREGSELVHFVGHLDGIKAQLTVKENLDFWSAYLDGGGGRDRGASIHAALERFGLEELADIPAGYLSAGQKRRLGLARLAVAQRPLWLLDEPTAPLDAASVARLVAAIDEHVTNGGIAVVTTHVPVPLARFREIRLGPVEGGQ
jgi:heme exporter protein A